jgi:ketosteroid isomerase-like protein
MLTPIMVMALGAALALGCAAPPPAAAPDEAALAQAQSEAVRETVTRVTHEIDAKRWDALRALYADEVVTDYTSLFGGAPQTQTGSALIDGWRAALANVTTHHQLGPITVKLGPSGATAECHVRALHRAEGAPGGSDWEVLGHYVFQLAPAAGGTWKIGAMTVLTSMQLGNAKLLQEVPAAR